jgi:hypothetical protein
MVKKASLLFLLASHSLFSVDKVLYPNAEFPVEAPWLTGPLIAPSSVVVPVGSYNIEPYFYVTAVTGQYDDHWKAIHSATFWSDNFQVPIQVGVLPRLDFQFTPGVYWNYTEHKSSWAFADLPVGVDIQVYDNKFIESNWMPSVKLVLREVFPTGKCNRLNPDKLGTDAGGFGSWISGFGLVFGKLIYLRGLHFLNVRFTAQYNLPSAVSLRGFNFYGGGYGTRAKYFPRQNIFLDLGLEFTLAQTWALACDFVANYYTKAHFSGFAGVLKDGSPASLSTDSKIQYSIAPAIEYNWSSNWGVIGGAWFTVAGRNSQQFFSGIVAINYYR